MKALKKLVLLLLAASAATLPAAAEVPDVELGDPAGSSQFSPSLGAPVARLADGSFAVGWVRGVSGQQATLQWVRPDGSELLPPGGLPLPGRVINGLPPVVAAHPTAGAFVAFPALTDRGTRIVVHSFDGDASPRWDAAGVVAVDSPGTNDQTFPQLLPGADGGVFVCFLSSRGATASSPLCQRIGPDGRPLWPGGRPAGGRNGATYRLSLVPDSQGGLLVFWNERHAASFGGHTFATFSLAGQRFSPEGRALWGAGGERLDVSDDPSQSLAFSLAVADGQGGAILAFPYFDRRHARAPFGIRTQRVDRDGELLWGAGVIAASGTNPFPDSLAPAPGGGAFLVAGEPLANSQSRLVLHRLDARGHLARPVAGTVLSAPGKFQADFSSQASFDGGRLRVLWGSHLLGDPLHLEVRIALFDAAGKRLSAPDNPPLATWSADAGPSFAGFAFDPGHDQGLAVWNLFRRELPWVTAGALFSGDTGLP